MNRIKIYGASDDLIEVDGDFRDEFCTDHGWIKLANGAIIEIEYNNSTWEIKIVENGVMSIIGSYKATEDLIDYSDILELEGDILPLKFYDAFPLIDPNEYDTASDFLMGIQDGYIPDNADSIIPFIHDCLNRLESLEK